MRVVINGKDSVLEPGVTIAALVASYKLNPGHVAVELNRDLVPRDTYEGTRLNEGDEIEIVTLVGGGWDDAPSA